MIGGDVRRRRLLVALVGLAGVLVVAGTTMLWPRPADPINFENFQCLRGGMTKAEVTAVLGPPGDYRTGPTIEVGGSYRDAFFDTAEFATAPDSTEDVWSSDKAWTKVSYSRSGATVAAFYMRREPETVSPLANLLWRAKRRWHRWFP
jgi:hypothetical protein